ncbi:Zinc finger FYVE domain-containing protein 26 [Actinomortierella ambigua]|nr:Zinc finger FYVE domain-containing protein 26 [Actinomortierella ambigua]
MDNTSNPGATTSTATTTAPMATTETAEAQSTANDTLGKKDEGEEEGEAETYESPRQNSNGSAQVMTGKIPTAKRSLNTRTAGKNDQSSTSRKYSTTTTSGANAASVMDSTIETLVETESMPPSAYTSRSSSSLSLAIQLSTCSSSAGATTQGLAPLSPTSPTVRPSPANKVLTRPLSTSQLTSSTMVMPHLSPTPARYADFNLASLGQLSPSASTATATLTRPDATTTAPLIPFLLSPSSPPLTCTTTSIHPTTVANHQHHNSNSSSSSTSYFSLQTSTKARPSSALSSPTFYPTHQPMFLGSSNTTYHIVGSGGERIPTLGGSGGGGASDAISLLDLDDSQDIVMIDSNGNSSGIGGTAHAVVGQTMASASAAMVTHPSTLSSTSASSTAAAAAATTSNGSGHSSSMSTIRPFSFANTLSTHLDFFDLSIGKHDGSSSSTSTSNPSAVTTTAPNPSSSTGSSHSTHGSGVNASPAAGSAAAALQSFHQQQQTLKESAAAARSSVPTLTAQAKRDAMQRAALIAAMQQNGGAKLLMQAHRVGRRHDRPSRTIRFSEFHKICEIEHGFEKGKVLYLFTDALVTGLDKTRHPSPAEEDLVATIPVQESVIVNEPLTEKNETPKRKKIKQPLLNNPYAGHLVNQQVTRIIQVQADAVENTEEPLLKMTIPSATYTLLFAQVSERDNFLHSLNEITLAHKNHLLSQSRYLADLKKFKRHSAFPFDTSFLKTWGIPGGLNLGNGAAAAAPHPYLFHQGAVVPPGGIAGAPSSGVGGLGTSGAGSGVGGATIKSSNSSSRCNRDSSAGSESQYGEHPMAAFMTTSPVTSPGGLLDHFSPQYYLQGGYNSTIRPQSTSGSFFNFSLVGGGGGGGGGSGSGNSYHGYATESSSGGSEQQGQHQHQLEYSYLSSLRRGSGGGERSSTGSTFDPTWFLKASETIKAVASRRNSAQVHSVAGPPVTTDAPPMESGDEAAAAAAAGAVSEMGEEGHSRESGASAATNSHSGGGGSKPPRWSTLATAPAAATTTTTATTSTSNSGSGGRMTITTTTTTTTTASSASAPTSAVIGGGGGGGGAAGAGTSSGGSTSNPSSPTSSNGMMTGAWARPMHKGGVDWVRDEDVAICMVCATTKFGVLVRKHHCRLCGHIICWRCCQMKEALQQTPSGALEAKLIRVCLDCIDQHQQWLLANGAGAQQPQPQQQQQQQQQSVFGKLLSMSSSSTSSISSSSLTTGYLRGNATSSPAGSGPPTVPHHGNPHRASMYKINVESVSEVDDEDEEDDEDNDEGCEEGDDDNDAASIDSHHHRNPHHHLTDNDDEDDDHDDDDDGILSHLPIHNTARIAARRRRQLAKLHPPRQRQSIYSLTTATRVRSRAAAMEAAAAAAATHMANMTTTNKTALPPLSDKTATTTTAAAMDDDAEADQDPDSTIRASKLHKGTKAHDLESIMKRLRIQDAPVEEMDEEDNEEEKTMEELLAEEDARFKSTLGL